MFPHTLFSQAQSQNVICLHLSIPHLLVKQNESYVHCIPVGKHSYQLHKHTFSDLHPQLAHTVVVNYSINTI